ncbi:hypothetical protein [Endozoicomonas sp. Mp262]|uniref:hypothetical protein n=1 Tax=Endozoicomonas sp. Mp262 TaxID=2919499 RepID=UPI0021D90F99
MKRLFFLVCLILNILIIWNGCYAGYEIKITPEIKLAVEEENLYLVREKSEKVDSSKEIIYKNMRYRWVTPFVAMGHRVDLYSNIMLKSDLFFGYDLFGNYEVDDESLLGVGSPVAGGLFGSASGCVQKGKREEVYKEYVEMVRDRIKKMVSPLEQLPEEFKWQITEGSGVDLQKAKADAVFSHTIKINSEKDTGYNVKIIVDRKECNGAYLTPDGFMRFLSQMDHLSEEEQYKKWLECPFTLANIFTFPVLLEISKIITGYSVTKKAIPLPDSAFQKPIFCQHGGNEVEVTPNEGAGMFRGCYWYRLVPGKSVACIEQILFNFSGRPEKIMPVEEVESMPNIYAGVIDGKECAVCTFIEQYPGTCTDYYADNPPVARLYRAEPLLCPLP